MKSNFLKLVIFISFCSPSFCKAQRILDYFEPDNLRLARLAWDESVDENTITWLQANLDTAHHGIKIWALHVMGVHLEQMPLIIDREQSKFENFQHQIISKLNTAKGSNNIDSTLIGFIDTTVFSGYHSHRATISHFLFDIVTIRQIKRTRRQGNERDNWGNNLFVKKFGFDPQKLSLEFAGKSKEEILSMVYLLFNAKDPTTTDRAALGWTLVSYRGEFIREFEQYYQPTRFNRLSAEGQSILLQYWSFNQDLMDELSKTEIVKLLRVKNSKKESSTLLIQKVMLRNLMLNRSREQYSKEIDELFNSDENVRYKEMTRQKVLTQNPVPVDSFRQSTQEQKEVPMEPRVRRPEDFVTMFNDCSEEELLEYLDQNLKIELYRIPGPKKIQEVINIRAAIKMLGNMVYSQKGIQANQSKYDSIVNKLVTIGILEMDESYSEATRLIYFLGNPAISFLKTEFFNRDLIRAQFATNKLIELKNLEVVNWMIRVIETNPDPMIKARALLALKIMKSYRDLQTANRGIAKEESDQIARDVISPYLERNQ